MRLEKLRKLGSWTLYAAYLVASLAAIDYFFFYRPYVRELRSIQKPAQDEMATEHLDAEVMKKIGAYRGRKRSAFTRFSREKPAGGVRICTFGDSLTYGAETGGGEDYPTRLQAQIDARGLTNVQVLNFGSNWAGFHQTFIMWNEVGRGYGCDVVVLGPAALRPDRDTTFNHGLPQAPYFLHARYVLADGDVELIEVLGDTHSERFEEYFRFFPRRRYLRYDYHPPAFLRALVPRDRELPNPFYYRDGDVWDEALATYRILLQRILAEGAQVVFVHYAAAHLITPPPYTLAQVAGGFEAPNLLAAGPDRSTSFPYLAPNNHSSGWGNDFLARQLLARIMGSDEIEIPILETAGIPAPESSPAAPRPLSEYAAVRIELDGSYVGNFGSWRIARRPASPAILREQGVAALLGFLGSGESILDACYVPLDFTPAPGAEVMLEDGGDSRLLGSVEPVVSGVNVWVLRTAGVRCVDQTALVLSGNADVSPDAIRIDGRTLSIDPIWRIRAVAGGFHDPDALAAAGTFDLVLEHPVDGTRRAPIARWRKTTRTLRWHALPEKRLAIGPNGRGVVR